MIRKYNLDPGKTTPEYTQVGPDEREALTRYIAAQSYPPTRSLVIRRAIRLFLLAEGFLKETTIKEQNEVTPC